MRWSISARVKIIKKVREGVVNLSGAVSLSLLLTFSATSHLKSAKDTSLEVRITTTMQCL